MNKYDQMASEILEIVGGKDNVIFHTNCLTRLRLTLKDYECFENRDLESLDYVMGLQMNNGILHVIVGPGRSQNIAQSFTKLVPLEKNEELSDQNDKSVGQDILKLIQGIVTPVIGLLIVLGLLKGIASIADLFGYGVAESQITFIIDGIGSVGFGMLGVFFAITTAKVLGGSEYLTTLMALFLYSDKMGDISLFGFQLSSGIGGVLGIVFASIVVVLIEKKLRNYIPENFQLLFVPLFTMLISIVIILFVVAPISGILTIILVKIVNAMVNTSGVANLISHVALAAAWPVLVMTGLQHVVLSVMFVLIDADGSAPLLAAAYLGGAAQMGTALAVWRKYRKQDPKLDSIITSGVPTVILGVVEPLMYGINIPYGKPFIISMIAAGIGGGIMSFFSIRITAHLSGVLAFTVITEPSKMPIYVIIWFFTAFLGYIFCWFYYKRK